MKSRSASKKTSFIPRSIFLTLEKLKQILDPKAESKLVKEFRASRYRTVPFIRCLLILIIVPLLVNQISKTFVIRPLINKVWSQEQSEVFLNSSQEERALAKIKRFEPAIHFEVLMGKLLKNCKKQGKKKLFS